MLKLLRKYNKWILVIGGSLLMVAFLAPGAIQNCAFNPRNETVARLDGRKLSAIDVETARRQLTVLRDAFPMTVNMVGGDDEVIHWMMLTHAAREGGFVGEKADGLEWATGQLATEIARQVVQQQWLQERAFGSPQYLQLLLNNPDDFTEFLNEVQQTASVVGASIEAQHDRIAGEAGLKPGQFDEALSATRGMWRMLESHGDAARLSDRRAIAYSDAQRDEAFVNAAFVPPAAVIDEIGEPTDEEIIAQFEAYKDMRPSEGEYGVGYTLPPRVKLNYLTLDRQAIANAITLDQVEANKYWTQNRNRFPGEYGAERRRVEADLTNQIVERIMGYAHEAVQRAVAQATSRLETDGDYRVLPDNWDDIRPRLDAIAPTIVEYVREQTRGEIIRNPDEGVTIPLPQVTVLGAEFQAVSDLQMIQGLGRATAQVGPRTFPMAPIALSVRELGVESQDLAVQVGIPMSEIKLEDPFGNRYYMTITDAREESPPDSFEELREELIRDVREIKAFALLEARLDEFRTLAAGDSVQAVADMFAPEEGSEERNPVQMRNRVRIGEFGVSPASYAELNQEELRLTVLEIAEELDPMAPMDQTPLADRTLAFPAKAQRGVVIAQVVALNPLTIELYRQVAQQDATEAKRAEYRDISAELDDTPFSYEALAERLKFKPVGRRAQEEAEQEAEQAAAEG